jgi:hypothetical protein
MIWLQTMSKLSWWTSCQYQTKDYYTNIRKHSLHKTSNENRKLLTDFAQEKNTVIRSIQFKDKTYTRPPWYPQMDKQ